MPCLSLFSSNQCSQSINKQITLLKREKDRHYFKLGHCLNSPSPLQSHSPLKFNMLVKQDKFDLTGNSENYCRSMLTKWDKGQLLMVRNTVISLQFSCFLKLARKIKFKFYFVWYCIKSSSIYPGEYVSVRRDSSPMYPDYGGVGLLRKAREDYVQSCLSSKITRGSKALNSYICCFHR